MHEVFEIWKDIEGYEGCYQVSNKGNVRSVDRYIECRGSLRMQKGKVLKPYVNKYGYRQVILNGKNRPRLCRINRLVAQAFIPNPNNLPQVNHKDEIKTNDCVENLEWCTCLYNLTYNDLHHRRNNMNNKKSKQVMQIKDGKVIATYPSINEAARKLNCGSGNIVRCCKGEKKTAYGYQWRYAESEEVHEKCI